MNTCNTGVVLDNIDVHCLAGHIQCEKPLVKEDDVEDDDDEGDDKDDDYNEYGQSRRLFCAWTAKSLAICLSMNMVHRDSF